MWLPASGGTVILIHCRIMNRAYKYIIAAVMTGLVLTACQEWIMPESLKVSVKNNGDADPALREHYLQNLRSYKESEHPLVYVTFDNVAATALNATALVSYLPDSVDVVEITDPDLHDWFAADMKKVQENFGTRFVLRISYDEITAPYGSTPGLIPVTEEEKTEIIATAVNSILDKVETFGFDGITVQFDGTLPTYMKPEELAAQTKKENDILPLIASWKEKNPDMLLFFNGVPTRTIDHTVPLAADVIIIPSVSLKSAYAADFEARNGANGEFRGARMMLETIPVPNDPLDKTTGRYVEGDSLPMMVEWMTTHVPEKYTLAGICIYHAEWDCLSTNTYYPVLRNAIKTLNPNS